jgi:transposase
MSDFAVIYPNVIGLDVHQKSITACALLTDANGQMSHHFKEFASFQEDLKALAAWALSIGPDAVIMESTGIYWKSPCCILRKAGLKTLVVNARHVKAVPGRKTDICDSLWLAMLGRAGLLRGSFIPPADLDQLRLVAHQRVKLVGMLSSEKNRVGKILADAGIRLQVVVSDIHGQAARRMIHCLREGGTPQEALSLAGNRLKASEDDLLRALDGDLSPSHKFIIRETLEHIQEIEARIKRFDEQLFHGLAPYHWALDILRTVPGLDMIGAAMLLVEIGVDMDVFGDASCLASWAGLCPGNNESAGKRKNGRSRKGNRHVRRQMCETANAARKTTSQFKGKYQSLVGRRGHKRGIIAIAHKLLRIVFALLKNKQAYRDETVNYEELMVKRNAPRWIVFLKKYHMMPQAAT